MRSVGGYFRVWVSRFIALLPCLSPIWCQRRVFRPCFVESVTIMISEIELGNNLDSFWEEGRLWASFFSQDIVGTENIRLNLILMKTYPFHYLRKSTNNTAESRKELPTWVLHPLIVSKKDQVSIWDNSRIFMSAEITSHHFQLKRFHYYLWLLSITIFNVEISTYKFLKSSFVNQFTSWEF